jgi:hypothetical protein
MSPTNVSSTNTTATPPQVREAPVDGAVRFPGRRGRISTVVAKTFEKALF